MRKNLFLTLVLVLGFIYANAGLLAFADNAEISEAHMNKAISAYKTGVSLSRAKSYENAIAAFEEALAYNPKMTDAYYNIASIYVKQKKYDQAYNAYVKIIALNPYDYDSILQAAKISYNRQNYALALKYLKYIPDDYVNYHIVQQLKRDAQELFDKQKNKIERSKVSTANENMRVLYDNFNSPAGVVVDSDGNMFVASYADNCIVKVDATKNRTNFVKGYLLNGPIGLAIDAYDNIYVANYDANNILKVTKGGNVSIFMEKVAHPYFLYIKNDVLYVSEQGNNAILKYNLSSSN